MVHKLVFFQNELEHPKHEDLDHIGKVYIQGHHLNKTMLSGT